MKGQLGLSTPWARQAIREPLRSELRALVPDDWTVGVSVQGDHSRVIAWANDDLLGRYALHIVRHRDAESAIRMVIAWIESAYQDGVPSA